MQVMENSYFNTLSMTTITIMTQPFVRPLPTAGMQCMQCRVENHRLPPKLLEISYCCTIKAVYCTKMYRTTENIQYKLY